MNMTDISIIIVNYNGTGFIEDCLESIGKKIFKSGAKVFCDVVIVDNCSSDGSRDFIEDFCRQHRGFRLVLNNTNTGFAHASNKGAELAGGKHLLFLNPDCRLLETGLESVIDFYEKKSDAGALGVRIVNTDGGLQPSCRAFPSLARQFHESFFLYRIFRNTRIFGSYFMTWWGHDAPMAVDWLSGSFILIQRERFEEAGGFDTDYFMYSEDSDLCLKLSRIGYRNYYYPYYQVMHADAGIASKDMALREADIWKSRRLYFKKNYSGAHAVIFSFIYFLGTVNRIIVFGMGSIFSKDMRKRVTVYSKALIMYFKRQI